MARVTEELREFKEQLRNEGRLDELARMAERKLARPMTGAERKGLQRRAAAGADQAGDAIFDLDAAALAAWLTWS